MYWDRKPTSEPRTIRRFIAPTRERLPEAVPQSSGQFFTTSTTRKRVCARVAMVEFTCLRRVLVDLRFSGRIYCGIS